MFRIGAFIWYILTTLEFYPAFGSWRVLRRDNNPLSKRLANLLFAQGVESLFMFLLMIAVIIAALIRPEVRAIARQPASWIGVVLILAYSFIRFIRSAAIIQLNDLITGGARLGGTSKETDDGSI